MVKTLRYLFASLLMLVCGNAMADEVTIDFTNKGYENAQEITTVEQDGITLTFAAGTNKNTPKYYTTGTAVRCYGGNTVTIASAEKSISKIEFTFASGEGSNSIIPNVGILDGTDWTGSAKNLTLTIDGTSGHRRIQKMVFTLSDETTTAKATIISFAEGYQTQIAQGPDGMFPEVGSSVALPTATVMADGAAVDGANVEWSLEVKSWKEKSEGEQPILNDGKISFEGYGVVSVKATFAGNDNYQASSKSYTLTVYNSYGLLSELANDIADPDFSKNDEADGDGKPVFYFFRNIDADGFPAVNNTVTFVSGKYIYLTDGNANLLFYGTNSQNLKQGDVISGNVGDANLGGFWGNLKRYNKLPEFAFTDMNVKVESEGAAVAPTTITVDQLKDYINAYVKVENAEFVSADGKNLTFKVGETNLAVYNQFNVDATALEATAKYTIVGMGAVYKENYQLYYISSEKTAEAGIRNVAADQKQAPVYNLNGQRVMNAQKGLFIIGGKKVIK